MHLISNIFFANCNKLKNCQMQNMLVANNKFIEDEHNTKCTGVPTCVLQTATT